MARVSSATSASCPHPGDLTDPPTNIQNTTFDGYSVITNVVGTACWNGSKVWESTPLNDSTIDPSGPTPDGCYASFGHLGKKDWHPPGITLSLYYCGVIDNDTAKMYQAFNACLQIAPEVLGNPKLEHYAMWGRYFITNQGATTNPALETTLGNPKSGPCPSLPSTASSGTLFTGEGPDFMNNAPKWTDEGVGKYSFHFKKVERQIIGFSGTYSFYCGAGTSTVTAKRIAVNAAGAFSFRFSVANTVNGQKMGETYVSISGQFLGGGAEVRLAYLVDTAFSPIKSPYDTSDPTKLGCASWVRSSAG